jgi:hypothetical protein
LTTKVIGPSGRAGWRWALLPMARTPDVGHRQIFSNNREARKDIMNTEHHHQELDPDAAAAQARREHRQGWMILVAVFGAGALLIALASMI